MAHLVVIDSCVLVRAAVRDTLLRAAQVDLFRPLWSNDILNEVSNALQGKLGKTPAQAQHLLDELKRSFPEATVAGYEALIDAMPVHDGDKHVAAVAVAGRADVILTFDLGDFPEEGLDPLFIEVQSPDEYLEHLFHLEADIMLRIIEEQAADLRRRPTTAAEVCGRLRAQGTPRFADLVEARL